MSDDTSGEYRIFGPPGTGKTHTLIRNIRNAAEKHGGHNVLCASFTKAAATELITRVAKEGIEVPDANVGTVHSLCYRGLGSPTLAEANIEDFNESVPPQCRLSKSMGSNVRGKLEDASASEIADEASEHEEADTIFSEYNLLRNRMVPADRMPVRVREWSQHWEKWKAENEHMDFTDLLEQGVRKMLYPPNGASILFVDEAQDLTPLQFSLVRAWGKNVRYYIVSGDDDQLLFAWSGASNAPLLDGNIDPSHIRVLSQSYRVPKAVHALANSWIKRVSSRQPKEYKPTTEPGKVTMSPATFRDVSPLRGQIEEAISNGKSFMLLVAAKYQLRPVLRSLKEWGIPFHNPFRKSAGDWNPIRNSQINRLKAFIHPHGPEFGGYTLWTPDQLKSWVEVCGASGLLVRGGKAAIERFASQQDWNENDLLDLYLQVFVPEALDQATVRNLDWLMDHLKPEKRAGHEYLNKLQAAHGTGVWDRQPAVIVGSIHSVKGGEADIVALFQDLPPTACMAVTSADPVTRTEAKDAIIRQYYVGMTRAREELIICSAATRFTVEVVR